MKKLPTQRFNAIKNYIKAYELFTSEKNGKSWRQCLIEAECCKSYPFMDLSKFSRRNDMELAVSDLVGFYSRVSHQRINGAFMEAITEIMTGTRVHVNQLETASDVALVKEMQKRRIVQNEDGEYVKIEIREVPIGSF